MEKEIETEKGTALAFCYGIFDSRFNLPINLMWKGSDGAKKASEYAHYLEVNAAPNRPTVALIPLQAGEKVFSLPSQKVLAA